MGRNLFEGIKFTTLKINSLNIYLCIIIFGNSCKIRDGYYVNSSFGISITKTKNNYTFLRETDLNQISDTGVLYYYHGKLFFNSMYRYDSGFCYFYQKNTVTSAYYQIVLDKSYSCSINGNIVPCGIEIDGKPAYSSSYKFKTKQHILVGKFNASNETEIQCFKYFKLSKDSTLVICAQGYNLNKRYIKRQFLSKNIYLYGVSPHRSKKKLYRQN